jgi:DNA-binding XRE family transcriptional regulator
MTEKQLIETLDRIRKERKWTQERMAQELGCARTTYMATVNGYLPLGITVIRGIMRSFPELREQAALFLAS